MKKEVQRRQVHEPAMCNVAWKQRITSFSTAFGRCVGVDFFLFPKYPPFRNHTCLGFHVNRAGHQNAECVNISAYKESTNDENNE